MTTFKKTLAAASGQANDMGHQILHSCHILPNNSDAGMYRGCIRTMPCMRALKRRLTKGGKRRE